MKKEETKSIKYVFCGYSKTGRELIETAIKKVAETENLLVLFDEDPYYKIGRSPRVIVKTKNDDDFVWAIYILRLVVKDKLKENITAIKISRDPKKERSQIVYITPNSIPKKPQVPQKAPAI